MNLKVPPMPQARPLLARDRRPPGKPLPPLPRSASARATPTRPRHPDAYESPCTSPRGERTKAPAQAAARAPPEPLRHPRLTAGSYPPLPRPPLALAICGLRPSSRVPIFTISVDFLLRSPEGSLYNLGGKGRSQRPFVHVQATIAAGRSESVARGIRDGGPRRQTAKPQAAGAS